MIVYAWYKILAFSLKSLSFCFLDFHVLICKVRLFLSDRIVMQANGNNPCRALGPISLPFPNFVARLIIHSQAPLFFSILS